MRKCKKIFLSTRLFIGNTLFNLSTVRIFFEECLTSGFMKKELFGKRSTSYFKVK